MTGTVMAAFLHVPTASKPRTLMTDAETIALIQAMKTHLDEMIGIGCASAAEIQLYTKIVEWQKNRTPAPVESRD